MAQPTKPCDHCGNTTFHCVPGMMLDVSYATTLLGLNVIKNLSGVHWTFTLLICTQCGCSRTFTANGPQLAQHVPGSSLVSSAPR